MVLFVAVTDGAYAAATENAVAVGYADGPTLSAAERDGLKEMAQVVH